MQVLKVVASSTLAVVVAGCAANQFNSTWRNPAADPVTLTGQPIVALVVSSQESIRRSAEDEVARHITERGGRGIAAYTICPSPDIEDDEKARAAFTRAGAIGVVTMEVVGQQRQPSASSWHVGFSRSSPAPFWGRYRSMWGFTHGHRFPPDVVVWIETHVYRLNPEALIWAARSRTTNPARADRMFGRLAVETAREMERAGLLTADTQRTQ